MGSVSSLRLGCQKMMAPVWRLREKSDYEGAGLFALAAA
jgi:hypothetical protein